MVEPLELGKTTINQLAYARIRELILSGQLAMGERLNEMELARGMGISRTPLREAISRLAREGLVQHRPYQGNFARDFSPEEVKDLFAVRKTLESMAIRLAIENLTDNDVVKIEGILDRAHQALDAHDVAAFSEADGEFHRIISELSGNEILQDFLHQIEAQIEIVRHLANRDEEVLTRTPGERERILRALTARDADAAAQRMVEHIEGVERSVIARVTGHTRPDADGLPGQASAPRPAARQL